MPAADTVRSRSGGGIGMGSLEWNHEMMAR